MTNKQYLIDQIKSMLARADVTDSDRVRLLALLARFVPGTRRKRKTKRAIRTAHRQPFQRPEPDQFEA